VPTAIDNVDLGRTWLMRVAMVLGLCLSGYLALAYLILPALWSHYEHQSSLRGRPSPDELSGLRDWLGSIPRIRSH
jgi:hypothetical protein